MSFRSQALLRCGAIFAAILLVSACTQDGRPVPLSEVEFVPPGNPATQTNININNPTLNVPPTFEVSPGDALTLVWSDEFDGAKLDPEVWFFATGDGTEKGLPGGWGNNELQYYLPDSAQLANGVLSITARRETVGGLNYTSARINTEDRFAFKYGRIEASIKLPSGQGLWPAFWMLSQDSPYGGWAATGEIDIMEAVNLDGTGGNEILGTIHYGGEFPANTFSSERYTPSTDVTADFHTYALEWDATEIRWYYDDTLYAVRNSWYSTAAPFPAPFDQPFHILLNLAVGGNLPGSPSGATIFPATMQVDWIRVYSGEDGAGGGGAGPGIIPDAVVYATDPGVIEDLAPTGFDNFGSGATFNGAYALDSSFNPVFSVSSGEGYGAGVHVGFVAFTGYAAGFAAGYETFDFKVKNLPTGTIEVKFIGGGDTSIVYDVTTYAGATDLGDGWYQLSIPVADFSATIANNDGFLLGPLGGQAGPFTFLLTDIGFSGTAPSPGITPEAVVYATDPGVTEDLAPPAIDNFGSGAAFDGAFAGDADYNPAFQVTSGEGYGGGVHVGFVAFNGYAAGFAAGYGTFEFKAKVNAPGSASAFEVKFINGGDTSVTYDLTSYAGSTALGNGWYQVQIPMSDFAATIAANSGFLLGPLGGQAGAFTMLLTDIGFSGTAGGGGNCDVVGGEYAVNGDFEAGDLSCFEVFQNGGSVTADNTENNGGSWSAHAVAGPGNNPVLKLERRAVGVVMGNDIIDISFDMKGVAADGGVIFPEFISEGAGGATQSQLLETIASPTAGWTTYSYSPTAAADVSGGITFQIAVVCGGAATCTANVFIDNVSMQIR